MWSPPKCQKWRKTIKSLIAKPATVVVYSIEIVIRRKMKKIVVYWLFNINVPSEWNVCERLTKKVANLSTWGSLSWLRSWVTHLAKYSKKGHISRARTDYKYLKSFTWMDRDWEKNMIWMCLSILMFVERNFQFFVYHQSFVKIVLTSFRKVHTQKALFWVS